MLEQQLSIALALVFRQNTDRPEGADLLFRAAFIRQPRLCVHDIADHTAVQLEHEVERRDKIRVAPHDAHQIVLRTAGHIDIVEGAPGDAFHRCVIRLRLISDLNHIENLRFAKIAAALTGRAAQSSFRPSFFRRPPKARPWDRLKRAAPAGPGRTAPGCSRYTRTSSASAACPRTR